MNNYNYIHEVYVYTCIKIIIHDCTSTTMYVHVCKGQTSGTRAVYIVHVVYTCSTSKRSVKSSGFDANYM